MGSFVICTAYFYHGEQIKEMKLEKNKKCIENLKKKQIGRIRCSLGRKTMRVNSLVLFKKGLSQ
jgi:hypothetical protein